MAGLAERPFAERLEHHTRRMRAMFYPKTDIEAPDTALQALAGAPLAPLLPFVASFPDGPWTALPRQGTFHALFGNGRGLVLKVNKVPHLFNNWQLHADVIAQQALQARGIGAIAVQQVDCSHSLAPFDYEVLHEAPGTMIAAFDADDAQMLPCLAAMGRQLAQVHAISGAGYGFLDVRAQAQDRPGALQGVHTSWATYLRQCLPAHLALLVRHADTTAAQAEAIQALFDADLPVVSAPRLLHGDCGSHNAFIDGGQVFLIDWEDALLGDPLYDLAFWATFHPERRWDTMFQAYFGHPWSPDAVFWLYFLRVAVAKTAHRRRFGYADVPGRPPASQRIQRALAMLNPAVVAS